MELSYFLSDPIKYHQSRAANVLMLHVVKQRGHGQCTDTQDKAVSAFKFLSFITNFTQ